MDPIFNNSIIIAMQYGIHKLAYPCIRYHGYSVTWLAMLDSQEPSCLITWQPVLNCILLFKFHVIYFWTMYSRKPSTTLHDCVDSQEKDSHGHDWSPWSPTLYNFTLEYISDDYSEQKNESQKRACSIMILRVLLVFPISEHNSRIT